MGKRHQQGNKRRKGQRAVHEETVTSHVFAALVKESAALALLPPLPSSATAAPADDNNGTTITKIQDSVRPSRPKKIKRKSSVRGGGDEHEISNDTLLKQSSLSHPKKRRLDDIALLPPSNEDNARDSTKQGGQNKSQSGPVDFPFPTEADDHCESPLEAYGDIQPLLQFLAQNSRRDNKDFCIYDPYFCNGSVVTKLTELGFPNVYNVKEDCYQVWRDPAHHISFDVLVTNPPYSGDHIEKLVNHVTTGLSRHQPWFLLLPTWVHKKDYFIKATTAANSGRPKPFFVVPRKRYVYEPPRNFRESRKSDVHKKSSPFTSMWYIYGGDVQEELIREFYRHKSRNCDLARSKSALRDLRRGGGR